MSKKYPTLKPVVDIHQLKTPHDWSLSFNNNYPVNLEIGFGTGEFLTRLAKKHLDQNFIGIEQNTPRIFKTIKKIEEAQLSNVCLIEADARIILERYIAPRALTKIYCLFPCPWPKKGHIRNRLFSAHFLRMINSRLVDGGVAELVTDYAPYAQWVTEEAVQETGFELTYQLIDAQFDTKFERKWSGQGQQKFFQFIFVKKRNIDFPVKENINLQVYFSDIFHPQQLDFQEVVGDIRINVIDTIVDVSGKKAMVQLVVSEEQLMQHLWVEIISTKKGWRVGLASGSNVFPTDGVAQAVEYVYNTVKQTG